MPQDLSTVSNVQRVKSLLPESLWNEFFPHALAVYRYEDFLKAVAKFPKFCGEAAKNQQSMEEACGLELATFLAHMKHESGSLQYVTEIACTEQQHSGCDYAEPASIYKPVAGKQYFGRGPFQLSWNYNYG